MPALNEYKKISDRAVKVIGAETIIAMSSPQRGLLNQALERLIIRYGNAEGISDVEIIGQYELIIDYALPTGTHEHLLGGLSPK